MRDRARLGKRDRMLTGAGTILADSGYRDSREAAVAKRLLFFFLSLVVSGSAATGSSFTKEITFDQCDLCFERSGGYDLVTLRGVGGTGEVGSPYLPRAVCFVLLPPSAEIEEVEVISATCQEIPGQFNILPVGTPRPLSSREPLPSPQPDPVIYSSRDLYPDRLAEAISTGTKGGYRIGSFAVCPVKWVPGEGRLLLHPKVKVRITFREGVVEPKPRTERQLEIFADVVRSLVVNPEDLVRWSPPLRIGSEGSKALPPGNYEYVVITPEADSSDFYPLCYWKTKKGVPARIVTREYIYSNYSGANSQEKIKNLIRDASNTWGTIWVVLGGDVGWVPYRGCYGYVASSPPEEDDNIPTGRYWEDLDNNWNYDGDSRYGETTDGPGGGDIDMYADVYVGRISCDSQAEVQRVLDRILLYEKNPPSGYLEKIVYFTDYLFGSKYGRDLCEDLIEPIIPAGWMRAKRYNENGWYASDDQAVGDMNQGYGFNMVASHGNSVAVMAGTGSAKDITVSDLASLLQAGDNRGIHTGICCMSGDYSLGTCYAEQLLNDTDSKIAGCIFNSRYGWGTTSSGVYLGSSRLTERLLIKIFNQNRYHLGQALAEARDYYVPQAGGYSGWQGVYRWCIFEYNLLGDPELPLWKAESSPMTVTHLPTVPSGPGEFTVTVQTGAALGPIGGALICCWCKEDSEMWVTGTTNAQGEATLTISPSISPDTMWVTVTKQDYLLYEGYTVVEPLSLRLSSFTGESIPGGVLLRWRTECETENLGYNLYRSSERTGDFGRVNKTLIPGSGSSSSPREYDYSDSGVEPGEEYWYRLEAVDRRGESQFYGPLRAAAGDGSDLSLVRLHPNPAIGECTIRYSIPSDGTISLVVYGKSGQTVRSLVNGVGKGGHREVRWDGDDDAGRSVSSGIYFCRLTWRSSSITQRLVLFK